MQLTSSYLRNTTFLHQHLFGMVVDVLLDRAMHNVHLVDYILDNFEAAKLPEKFLDVIFQQKTNDELKTSSDNQHGQLKCPNLMFPFARSSVAAASIKDIRVLVPHSLDVKKIVELTLNTEALPANEYLPGDTIGILPHNCTDDVYFVLEALNLLQRADTKCMISIKASCKKKAARVPAYIPVSTTPKELLQYCLSLRSVPKKQFLRTLAEYCSDNLEQKFLFCLSSKEGAHYYNELILERGNSFLDLLRLCPTCCPPLAVLLEHLPRLMPRPYSIASSPLAADNEIKIVFSILPQNPGVCSDMLDQVNNPLKQLQLSSILMYFRETNKFRYSTEEVRNDCILIGIGTAVAPFLGFLEHKSLLSERENTEGETWLFSGAKTIESAFGRNRLRQFKESSILNKYFEAFSRDSSTTFKYVQDVMLTHCKEFVDFLLKPSTILFVCADGARISKSIEDGIKKCFMEALTCDDSEAMDIIKEFRRCGKYREDLWA